MITLPRLSDATLSTLPPDIGRPRYDRHAIATGVVHLGVGAFHRAHQAAVFDAALTAGDRRWGVVGASLRSAAVRDALAPQDGLYTITVRDGRDERDAVIGAMRGVLVAREDPAALVARMAHRDTHIVTLTITEKGYPTPPVHDAPPGDADFAMDLASLDTPRTAPGLIAAALDVRRMAGLAPFTAISCDNLPANGDRLRAGVLAVARSHDRSLADWIERHGAFPATMVDRIVPATTSDDVDLFGRRTGLEDRGLVKTEPYLQWVIEDRFAGERPAFEDFGVRLASAIAPWEEAKLRLLNGAHSALAYLGALTGYGFVHEAIDDAALQGLVERLWDEAVATLTLPPGLDPAGYRAALTRRFRNASLRHRLIQIAADGSQKLPQRLVAPLVWRANHGLASPALVLAVAAWIRWQVGRDDAGRPHPVDDPLAPRLAAAYAASGSALDRVRAVVRVAQIFPDSWTGSTAVLDAMAAALGELEQNGAAAAAEALLRTA